MADPRFRADQQPPDQQSPENQPVADVRPQGDQTPPVPPMLLPRGIPKQPEFDLEGPARDTFGSTLAGRDYVPVEEWQIENTEIADIGHWGDDPPPVYTRDLSAGQRRAAEGRIKEQVDKARGQAGATDNVGPDGQNAPDEPAKPDGRDQKPPATGSGYSGTT